MNASIFFLAALFAVTHAGWSKRICSSFSSEHCVEYDKLVEMIRGGKVPMANYGAYNDFKAAQLSVQELNTLNELLLKVPCEVDLAKAKNKANGGAGNMCRLLVIMLENLGDSLVALHRVPEALRSYDRAFEHNSAVPNDNLHESMQAKHLLDEGQLLTKRATCHGRLKSFAQAIELYRQALVIYMHKFQGQAQRELADAITGLGVVHLEMGSHKPAIKYLKSGVELEKKLAVEEGMTPRQGELVVMIAHAHRNASEFNSAMTHYKEALGLFQEALKGKEDSTPHIAETLFNIGNVYLDKKDQEKALDFYKQAAAAFRRVYGTRVDRTYALCLRLVGQLLGEQDDGMRAEALQYMRESLVMTEKIYQNRDRMEVVAIMEQIAKMGGSDEETRAKEMRERIMEANKVVVNAEQRVHTEF